MNAPSVAVLQVNDLAKRVQLEEESITILESVNLTINPGESVAIIGPSGSGKSTLLSLLAGLDQPSGGSIHLMGQPFDALSEDGRAAARAGTVGFVFQNFQLLPALTALENVMLPLELQGEPEAKSRAARLLDQVGLNHRMEHLPGRLSGGEQQRVAIARAFAARPKLLFADEPTGNLDAKNSEKIEALLFDLNREYGTTLVLVTHDTQLAQRCQRRLVLDNGTLEEAHV
ncbi:MAG: ABC transporter ATP-binding protein [Litorivicinus sp.]